VARVLRMPEVADDPTAATLTAWLVDESADFGGAQSIATVETASSLLSIEVSEPGVLIKSLVEPGQEVLPGSPLAVLGAPGEVVEDVEQLMVQLGLGVTPGVGDPDVHLRAVPHDELRRTAEAVRASNAPVLGETAARLDEAVDSLERSTRWLLSQKSSDTALAVRPSTALTTTNNKPPE